MCMYVCAQVARDYAYEIKTIFIWILERYGEQWQPTIETLITKNMEMRHQHSHSTYASVYCGGRLLCSVALRHVQQDLADEGKKKQKQKSKETQNAIDYMQKHSHGSDRSG